MKQLLVVGLLACAALCAVAQTPPPAPPPAPLGFTGGSDAIAFHYNNGWSAGTTVTESFDFMDFGASKTNRLFLEGKELLAPTPGLNLYMGGIAFQPDFTKALAKTNVTPGSFSAIFDASVGDGLPGAGGSHIAYQVGAGVKYQVTSSLTWQSLNAFYGRFGSTPFAGVSTGLAYFFSK